MENTNIEDLYQTSLKHVRNTKIDIHRHLYYKINWDNWLIAIKGARGVGKTTLILQHIKETFADNPNKALYISLDNLFFSTHTLSEVVDYHYTHGGTHIFIDEIHRYPHWQTVIKNTADEYPELHIVYTGSSMLKMDSHEGDLSRRQLVYTLNCMSFREYLLFEGIIDFKPLSITDLLSHHIQIAMEITEKTRILTHFEQYLKNGCYPFYKRDLDGFSQRLQTVVRAVLLEDMPAVDDISYQTIQKTMRLLMLLAENVPHIPKMAELYKTLETNRIQGLKMLSMLERGGLLQTLSTQNKNLLSLTKPDKIYLNNTNLMYSLTTNTDKGTLRETFFMNQLAAVSNVCLPPKGDFLIDKKYLFEVGGKKKSFTQIKDIADSFVAADDIEIGVGNKIPLWMFGLLY